MTWSVPRTPDELVLPLRTSWDGSPLADPRLHGFLALSAATEGLRVRGGLPDPAPGSAPPAPVGSRVANLWETDVVELFWVGPEGRYVELELGAHGHFLVLSFRAPRARVDEHESLRPELRHRLDARGWETSLCLPWSLLPQPLEALGAFALAHGACAAAHPVPGSTPDFHQPAHFPRARLAPR
jgi:hypothetical protein